MATASSESIYIFFLDINWIGKTDQKNFKMNKTAAFNTYTPLDHWCSRIIQLTSPQSVRKTDYRQSFEPLVDVLYNSFGQP
jgi:hypothetical protein